MIVNILTFLEVTALFSFIGGSIYVSFFHNKDSGDYKYQGKKKLSFNRDTFSN